MAFTDKSSLFDLRELHALLHRHRLAAPFRFALYRDVDDRDELPRLLESISRQGGGESACARHCLEEWRQLIERAVAEDSPQVGTCRHGLLGFALPLAEAKGRPACLLAGGVRDRLARPAAPVPLGSPLLPALSPEEARQFAAQVSTLLQPFCSMQVIPAQPPPVDRLAATRDVVRGLGGCTTTGEALNLVSDALLVIFELARVVFVWRDDAGQAPPPAAGAPDTATVGDRRFFEFCARPDAIPLEMNGEVLARFLPGLQGERALIFPLQQGERLIGVLALLDALPGTADRMLIDLLACHLTARLLDFERQDSLDREQQGTARILAMVGSLAQAGGRDGMLRGLLDMVAELTQATSGSLMLYDEKTASLRIAAAKRMSAPLARSMSVPFGQGIAGRVASSGEPLLVSDIERDTRTAILNRPRFRTKSFISLPFYDGSRLLGVINLADRQDDGCFTAGDLRLAQLFLTQASLVIERSAILERNDRLVQLSLTDPLTGVYNRRFLETRFEEERSRSQRQDCPFTMIMADLDHFKMYNDLCGHLAGDRALCAAAAAMRRAARDMDVLVRYGGEEFCLLLPATGKAEAFTLAERLRQAIEEESFPGEEALPGGQMSISLGVATYPEDGHTLQELLAAADLALYRAKEQGRNRTVVHQPGAFTFQQPAAVIPLNGRS